MLKSDIPPLRLYNQCLTQRVLDQPEDVVAWLGAVQSQDYSGAKWALGLRMRQATDALMDRAFNDGNILRTHALRPTWHFVTPADIRWILELTAPRVHAINGTMYRQLELDGALFRRSREVFAKALQGGHALTRAELGSALAEAGIPAKGLRQTYLVMNAELEAVICSGPRRGKQFTYMLLEERAPRAQSLERDEALAELVRRYFRSHGPATAKDFVWWSGLTLADARKGLEMVKSELVEEVIDDRVYWFSPSGLPMKNPSLAASLLPNYDEFGSYQDRSAVFDPARTDQLVFDHMIVIDGRVAGTWRRTFKKGTVVIEPAPFLPLAGAEAQAFTAAAERFGEFLGLPVVFSVA